MIVKPLAPPLRLLQTEALDMRLPVSHPQKELVASDAGKRRAGYNGEASLQFQLDILPYEKYLIFHHLRIPDPHGHFQMDILLLSSSFILIIEVKNIRDHVIFNEMGQTIRVDNEKEQSFTNPIYQVNLQHTRLLRWLQQFSLPSIPIEKLAVYSNSHTILKNLTNDKEVTKTVIHKEKMLQKIEDFSNTHRSKYFTENQLSELSLHLQAAHEEEDTDVMKLYGITYEQLIKGVICPACRQAPMLRAKGKWLCRFCSHSSKTAHRTALAHYALLVSNYISNQQAREFLQLGSSNVTKQLLQKENLQHFGKNSGRKYILDLEKLLRDSH